MARADTLSFISQQIELYFGMFIFIVSITDNIFNIIIFLTLQTFRETSSGFYFIPILIALFIRVPSEGFKTDVQGIAWI